MTRLWNRGKKAIRHRVDKLLKYQSIKSRTENSNVYHCCVQKTASQWLKAIFSDNRFYKYSGLVVYEHHAKSDFDERPLHKRIYTMKMPKNTIVTPLYIGYDAYQSIQKSGKHKAFFVMRDPRDIVVSWYYSARATHSLMGPLDQMRSELSELSIGEGLKYSINVCDQYGLFDAMVNWKTQSIEDTNAMIIRFEDITDNEQQFDIFDNLFSFCDIQIPPSELNDILNDYSFEALTSGRKKGDEDQSSHFRKGTSGEWESLFTDEVNDYFSQKHENLLDVLEYTE